VVGRRGLLQRRVGRRTEADLAGPSLLLGWPRRTVVAHVARNADALVNQLTWARTGEESPMYASTQARDTAIAATGGLPDLTAWVTGGSPASG
jgi:maleylpyruvate isomerase